jgi:hypothetical protein
MGHLFSKDSSSSNQDAANAPGCALTHAAESFLGVHGRQADASMVMSRKRMREEDASCLDNVSERHPKMRATDEMVDEARNGEAELM